MLTSEDSYNDEFTFEITDAMTTKKLDVKYCQARLHLISFFRNEDIIQNANNNNFIKQMHFNNLLREIFFNVFEFED